MSVAGPLGRYTVLRLLAKGGMADLLLARATGVGGFERHVVIKRLREEQANDTRFVKNFVTEARLAGQLHHHNIIQVQDTGEEAGRPYFAMEYVHGEDLRKLLRKLRDLEEMPPIANVVAIISAAATALHHAHEQRGPDRAPLAIVHRDVSPSNILVGYDGNVKVLDFGIAKAAFTIETQSGTLKGKVPYMSPEQCTNRNVDRRSDIFSLGIVMYELCTVRRLFKGDTHFLTMSAIVHGTVPRPSKFRKDLPLALEKIIMKALARDPDDRYQTAEEMRAALDTFASRTNMPGTPAALAAYMKKLFGEPLEPWHTEHDWDAEAEAEVDFDGTVEGIAEPPTEVDAMPMPEGSPIKRAHLRTSTSSAVVQSGTPPELAARSGTIERSPEGGDGDSTTAVSTPPPMPTVMTAPRMTEATQIVEPLEVPEATGVIEMRRKSHKRWMVGGLIAAVGIAVMIAIVIGFASDQRRPDERKPIDTSLHTPPPPPADEVTPPVEKAVAPPVETKAEEPAPVPDHEAVAAVAPPPPPQPDEPAPEIEMTPEAAQKPATDPAGATTRPVKSAPARPRPVRTAATPKPVKTTPKPPPTTTATTTATTTPPPRWDPDALLPPKTKP